MPAKDRVPVTLISFAVSGVWKIFSQLGCHSDQQFNIATYKKGLSCCQRALDLNLDT